MIPPTEDDINDYLELVSKSTIDLIFARILLDEEGVVDEVMTELYGKSCINRRALGTSCSNNSSKPVPSKRSNSFHLNNIPIETLPLPS
jgi:hypothetical protein